MLAERKIRLYIIKNISPWIIDEMLSFSKNAPFHVLMLRNPPDFYYKDIELLKENGIFFCPSTILNISFKRLYFCIKFFWNTRSNYSGWYNIFIGIQSIYYFLKIDDALLSNITSMHAQFATQSAIVACMIKEYLRGDVDFYVTCHAYDIFYKNSWLKYIIERTNYTFSISEFNISYILNQYKTGANKIVLSRLGVKEHGNGRKACYKGPVINIGFLSFFAEKKGIRYLLDAILILKSTHNISFKMHIAGDGDKRHKKLINTFIKNNNLEKDVILYGRINGERKDIFYKSIDVFVLPSVIIKNDMDGIPVVLMEAISYGIPIISTDISGISEICLNNVNGVLIPQKDPYAISLAIKYIYNNHGLWEHYSVNSSLVQKERYSIDHNSKIKMKFMNWT